jgi:pimeloyl-ACP methyl ester carboxylesterase
MSDSRANPQSTPTSEAEARARLIHAVYQIALEPQSYDVFMDHWDSHVSRALSELEALQDQSNLDDAEIVAHFNTAFGILEELGRRPEEPLRDGSGPRLLLDARGAVVWFNDAAARTFSLAPGAHVDDLAPHLHDPGMAGRLVKELATARPGDASACRLLRLDLEGRTHFLLARPITDREGQSLVLVEPLHGEWTPEMGALLTKAFELTEAETEVAANLAEGLSPKEIADRRGVSVLTVRTQIKALLAKTGAAGQTDLVRLLASVSRVVDRTLEDDAPARPAVCITAKGREIPIELMGSQSGFPVLFLHGMLDGCSATPRIELALNQHRLRVIAPVRPGFGTAPAHRGHPSTGPRRFAEDIEGLLDRLRLRQVVLLGHMAGALYAFAVAERLGDRVAGIVNVAGTVPIVSTAQLATMSRRQRVVAYTARYAPAALPFVLRAGIRQLDFNGERSFMRALYESSPLDLATIEDPDVYRSLRRGYRFTVAQGHRAFEADGYHAVRDWSEMASASTVPVTLIHGRHDPVVDAASVEDFAQRLGPRAKVRILDDCGQLVLYHAPEAVCEAVAGHVAGAERSHSTEARSTT